MDTFTYRIRQLEPIRPSVAIYRNALTKCPTQSLLPRFPKMRVNGIEYPLNPDIGSVEEITNALKLWRYVTTHGYKNYYDIVERLDSTSNK